MLKLLQIIVPVICGSTIKITEQIGKLDTSKGWKKYIDYSRYDNSTKSELIELDLANWIHFP